MYKGGTGTYLYHTEENKPVLWIHKIFPSDPDPQIRIPELRIRILEANLLRIRSGSANPYHNPDLSTESNPGGQSIMDPAGSGSYLDIDIFLWVFEKLSNRLYGIS